MITNFFYNMQIWGNFKGKIVSNLFTVNVNRLFAKVYTMGKGNIASAQVLYGRWQFQNFSIQYIPIIIFFP